MRQVRIDPLSCVPLHLESYLGSSKIGGGTGFIVTHSSLNYIITNWHVVTGRNPQDNQPLSSSGTADPDRLSVWFHAQSLGSWIRKDIALFDESTRAPTWKGHPTGHQVDVVALPVSVGADVKLYPLDLSLSDTDLIVPPSEPVSIVGFPYGGSSAGKFPIWKTGNIASDIDLDCNNKPIFLIDATTKPGMSGSPVIARRRGFRQTSTGWHMGGGESIKFLGIYSGRMLWGEEKDIGTVWKPHTITEIIAP